MMAFRKLFAFVSFILIFPHSASASDQLTMTLICEGKVSNVISRTPKPDRMRLHIEKGKITEGYFGKATSTNITEDYIKARFGGDSISISRKSGKVDVFASGLIFQGFICKKAPKKMF
jgi:hypothetical protein